MFEQRRGLVRDPGHEECVVLLGLQQAAFEERNLSSSTASSPVVSMY
jgi:hypothetical protein